MSSDRIEEVRAALSEVADPELDQSVVDLGFVERIAVEDRTVEIDYRLPTFWCSANFAWIMSEDMHKAVASLDWVGDVRVRLVDHFAADRINAAVAAEEQFAEAFGAEAGGNLSALRETFRKKAFLGRVSAAIDALRKSGWREERIVALTVGEITALAAGDDALAPVLDRYLQFRRFYGGPPGADDLAFCTIEGAAIEPAGLAGFLRDIRLTRRGVEANGEMCRLFLKARRSALPADVSTPPEPASLEK